MGAPPVERTLMPEPFDPLANPTATVACHPGLIHAPATARNREPIRLALADLLPSSPCTVLELASGTGEHALWMVRSLPQVTWLPSEATPEGLATIDAWRGLCPKLAERVASPGPDRHGPTAVAWPGGRRSLCREP